MYGYDSDEFTLSVFVFKQPAKNTWGDYNVYPLVLYFFSVIDSIFKKKKKKKRQKNPLAWKVVNKYLT